ncbi:hypothetical protein AX14_005245 [Amanita brunnescens Koide BX004]|nr:hypothetical protein AX14_005245 [Amanita brunnescens Koide BX004]
MDDIIKDGIKDALTYFFPLPDAEIMVLNKPPTTALKFLAVPRHNLDGSDADEMDLLNDLTAHPAWSNVELWANPKFINLKAGMAGATVVVSVVDDAQGNVGCRLMGSMVNFSGPFVASANRGATLALVAQQMSSYAPDVAACMTSGNMIGTVTHVRKVQAIRAPPSAETATVVIWRLHGNAPSGLVAAAKNDTPNYMQKSRPNFLEKTKKLVKQAPLERIPVGRRSSSPSQTVMGSFTLVPCQALHALTMFLILPTLSPFWTPPRASSHPLEASSATSRTNFYDRNSKAMKKRDT